MEKGMSLILTNLERFGITDMTVTGVFMGDTDPTVHGALKKELCEADVLLSHLCNVGNRNMCHELGIDPQETGWGVDAIIKKDGQRIGCVSSNHFYYEAAPDLRTALGWSIATEYGREHLIEESFDLDEAKQVILNTININGTGEKVFRGEYFQALKKRVVVYEHTSSYSDGYLGFATMFWRLATRELGEEHPGYPFCY